MTTVRPPAPTIRTVTRVGRGLAGPRTVTLRSVVRLTCTVPPLRTPDPPHGPSHDEVWRRWEELEWWSCAYCDAAFGRMVVAEVDHIRPLAKGGLHNWENLVPACRYCNRSKSDQDIAVWITLIAGQRNSEGDVSVTQRDQSLSADASHDLHKVTVR